MCYQSHLALIHSADDFCRVWGSNTFSRSLRFGVTTRTSSRRTTSRTSPSCTRDSRPTRSPRGRVLSRSARFATTGRSTRFAETRCEPWNAAVKNNCLITVYVRS